MNGVKVKRKVSSKHVVIQPYNSYFSESKFVTFDYHFQICPVKIALQLDVQIPL